MDCRFDPDEDEKEGRAEMGTTGLLLLGTSTFGGLDLDEEGAPWDVPDSSVDVDFDGTLSTGADDALPSRAALS